jgi:hypothetical protein
MKELRRERWTSDPETTNLPSNLPQISLQFDM